MSVLVRIRKAAAVADLCPLQARARCTTQAPRKESRMKRAGYLMMTLIGLCLLADSASPQDAPRAKQQPITKQQPSPKQQPVAKQQPAPKQQPSAAPAQASKDLGPDDVWKIPER